MRQQQTQGTVKGGGPSIVSMANVWVLQHDVQNQLGSLRNNSQHSMLQISVTNDETQQEMYTNHQQRYSFLHTT